MEFLNFFVMALSPIIVVLVGILGFRQSAKKSGPGGPYMDAGAGFYLLQYHRRVLWPCTTPSSGRASRRA